MISWSRIIRQDKYHDIQRAHVHFTLGSCTLYMFHIRAMRIYLLVIFFLSTSYTYPHRSHNNIRAMECTLHMTPRTPRAPTQTRKSSIEIPQRSSHGVIKSLGPNHTVNMLPMSCCIHIAVCTRRDVDTIHIPGNRLPYISI